MGLFDLLMMRPNLGNATLVNYSRDPNGFSFYVWFAGINDKLDIKSILNKKLFLQSLSDTRNVLNSLDNIKNIQTWPVELRKRLVPLSILNHDAPIKFTWNGIVTPNKNPLIQIKFDFAYRTQINIHLPNANIPQLFNIIQISSDNQIYNINFHSLYIHNKDWHNFSFIQATDSHIAWRNDFIPKTIQEQSGQKPANYINWNSNFRNFIKYANTLHSQGECDFIIISGDIVDYINVEEKFTELQPNSNFEFFRDLIIGWNRYEIVPIVGKIIGEELQVPIYTILGNHDYRPAAYPLVAIYESTTGGINLYTHTEYAGFGLTLEEGIAYHKAGCVNWDTDDTIGNGKVKAPTWDADHGIYHQSHINNIPIAYSALLNPDLDYSINLGSHKIICLDSGFDWGNFGSVWDAINYKIGTFRSKSTWNFKNGSPDGSGFSENQIKFLQNSCDISGLKIIASHHPLINFRENPLEGVVIPRLFRQSERESAPAGRFPDLKNQLNYIDQIGSDDSGWLFSNTPFFRKGTREIYISKRLLPPPAEIFEQVIGVGDGVPNFRFDEIMQIIYNKNVKLILSGHTHRSSEYLTKLKDNEHEYYHDYYIDGKFKGVIPKTFWKKSEFWQKEPVDYPDILFNSSNLKGWWEKHSPLYIQAPSVASPPFVIKENSDHGELEEKIGVLKIDIKDDQIRFIRRIYFRRQSATSLRNVTEGKCCDPLSLRQLAIDMAREADTISMRELAVETTIVELVPEE